MYPEQMTIGKDVFLIFGNGMIRQDAVVAVQEHSERNVFLVTTKLGSTIAFEKGKDSVPGTSKPSRDQAYSDSISPSDSSFVPIIRDEPRRMTACSGKTLCYRHEGPTEIRISFPGGQIPEGFAVTMTPIVEKVMGIGFPE